MTATPTFEAPEKRVCHRLVHSCCPQKLHLPLQIWLLHVLTEYQVQETGKAKEEGGMREGREREEGGKREGRGRKEGGKREGRGREGRKDKEER